jgi:hypothetical protein
MQLSYKSLKISRRQRIAMTARHVIAASFKNFSVNVHQNILTILQGVAALGVEVTAQVLIDFCIAVEVGLIRPCSTHSKRWAKFRAEGVAGRM